MRQTWDDYFMDLSGKVASRSKDRSNQVGAVAVGPDKEVRSTGYNGFPRGVKDDVEERHQRPAKYLWAEHAERNAVYNAARMGTSLKGCTLYVKSVPEPLPPCADCARAIIQAGIVKLVCEKAVIPERWLEQCLAAFDMLKEAGVEVVQLEPRKAEGSQTGFWRKVPGFWPGVAAWFRRLLGR